MTSDSAESRAVRRLWAGGFIGFLAGWLGTATVAAYLLIRFMPGPRNSWEVVDYGFRWLMYVGVLPLFAGLGPAVGCSAAIDRWNHWRGYHRCFACGRPLCGSKRLCPCREDDQTVAFAAMESARRRRRQWSTRRHYRRRIGASVLVVLGLTPVTWAICNGAGRHRALTPTDAIAMHVLVCHLAFVIGEVASDLAKATGRAKRFRPRWLVTCRLVGAWSVLGLGTYAALDHFFERPGRSPASSTVR